MNHKVAVFGEALIDLIQQENGDYRPFIGGSPFNVARGFVRQGLDCQYLSPVSTDHFGSQIFQSIADEGISIPENNRSAKVTSLALVYRDEQGQPDYRLYRNDVADLDVTAAQLLAMLPPDLELFHTGSLALVPAMEPVLIPVLEELKRRGCKISVDVNVRTGVELDHQRYVDTIWRIIDLADIVKVSDEDFSLMGLTDDPIAQSKAMLDNMDNGLVVLTLGEKGAYLIAEQTCIQQDIYRLEHFSDTVGAGDTFFSAMLAQMLREQLLKESASEISAQHKAFSYALKFGSLAAAMNVAKVGCHPPTYEEVTSKLQQL
ncbi:MAG: carbohydrate kinase family protein [Aestuariibacter sp.]